MCIDALRKLLFVCICCLVSTQVFAADTNTTVSSTVVTDKTPPTASAPSVNVNNNDVCKSASSAAIQTQIFGFASGITVLCQDSRVFDGMWMAGTPCPYKGKIGDEARQAWLNDFDLIPEGTSVIKEKVEKEEELPLEEEWGE